MTSSFASDNAAGAHPDILAAISRANTGHALAYGEDPHTASAVASLRRIFGEEAEVLLVYNGTAANVLCLRALVDSYQSIVCADTSHLWIDECSAAERFLGSKLVPIRTPAGKLTPELVRPALRGFGVVHHAQPRAISVAQPTEWGTLYTVDELRALADLAHEHDMVFHIDGARLGNAAAAMNTELSSISRAAGADALSLGGTKLGLLFGEAVLFFNPEVAARARFHRKQGMQLASKMRFIAVQMEALYGGDLWRRLADHANSMARRLAAGLASVPGVEIVRPVETNAVFARLPDPIIEPLQQHAYFHRWDESAVRLMTAWDTEPEAIDAFAARAAQIASAL